MSVFGELREAFRQAVRNFKEELHRDEVPDRVDALVSRMRDELIALEALIRRLEEDVWRAADEAAGERREAETCRRREALAAGIGDDETARIASEFASKHEARRRILMRKAGALDEELELRRREREEMRARLSEAISRRDTLAAAAGRTDARDALGGADALFEDLERVSDRIEDDARRGEARSELDRPDRDAESGPEGSAGDEASGGPGSGPFDPEDRAAARLEALKRRMGSDGRG